MTDCLHGYASPASCIDCMDDGNIAAPPQHEPEAIDFEFTAKFDSQCPICDLPTRVGEPIARTTVGRYIHPECVS